MTLAYGTEGRSLVCVRVVKRAAGELLHAIPSDEPQACGDLTSEQDIALLVSEGDGQLSCMLIDTEKEHGDPAVRKSE